MPGLMKTLKKWIGDSYDSLGLVLMCSFVWFGAFLAAMTLIVGIGKHTSWPVVFGMVAALLVFVMAPLTAGAFVLAKKIVTRDDPSIMDLFHGLREYLVPAWTLGFWQLFITALIAVNAWFYLRMPSIVWKSLGVLVIYTLIVWALSATYHYPVLIEQRPGTFKILKRSFLLVLDNVAFTLGVFFAIILLTCFTTFTLIGLPILFMGMLSILQTRALRALFVKYELIAPEREYLPVDETKLERLTDLDADEHFDEGNQTDGGSNVSRHSGSGSGGETG